MAIDVLIELAIRGIIIYFVYKIANEKFWERKNNAVQNGWFFSFFPFYIFVMSDYQKYDESFINFIAAFIVTSVIFGFIAFWIGFFITKIRKK